MPFVVCIALLSSMFSLHSLRKQIWTIIEHHLLAISLALFCHFIQGAHSPPSQDKLSSFPRCFHLLQLLVSRPHSRIQNIRQKAQVIFHIFYMDTGILFDTPGHIVSQGNYKHYIFLMTPGCKVKMGQWKEYKLCNQWCYDWITTLLLTCSLTANNLLNCSELKFLHQENESTDSCFTEWL